MAILFVAPIRACFLMRLGGRDFWEGGRWQQSKTVGSFSSAAENQLEKMLCKAIKSVYFDVFNLENVGVRSIAGSTSIPIRSSFPRVCRSMSVTFDLRILALSGEV